MHARKPPPSDTFARAGLPVRRRLRPDEGLDSLALSRHHPRLGARAAHPATAGADAAADLARAAGLRQSAADLSRAGVGAAGGLSGRRLHRTAAGLRLSPARGGRSADAALAPAGRRHLPGEAAGRTATHGHPTAGGCHHAAGDPAGNAAGRRHPARRAINRTTDRPHRSVVRQFGSAGTTDDDDAIADRSQAEIRRRRRQARRAVQMGERRLPQRLTARAVLRRRFGRSLREARSRISLISVTLTLRKVLSLGSAAICSGVALHLRGGKRS